MSDQNAELKALIDIIFGLADAGIALAEKKDLLSVVVPKLEAVALSLPNAISNWNNLQGEVSGLVDLQAEQDLAAYVVSKFAVADAKSQAIVKQSLQLAIDAVSLAKAIKG